MKQLRFPTALAALLLGAAPAVALGIPLDLPRLEFPAPQPTVSRDCPAQTPATPTCVRTQK